MIFFVFRKFGISIFPIGKKSTFVPKIGDFSYRKRFSNFFNFFLNCSLGKIIFLKFRTFCIFCPESGKKSTFVPKIGGISRKKVVLILLKLGTYEVQVG